MASLAKVLTPENRAEVLPRFLGTSKREAKEVAAELAPMSAPPLRTVVTAVALELPPPSPGTRGEAVLLLPEEAPAPAAASGLVADPPPRPTPAVTQVEPLTAELRRLHVTVSRRLLDKLEAARDALSHSHPGASEEVILEVGLDLIIERWRKRRGIGAKPRRAKGATPTTPTPTSAPPLPPRSRHVPASVWREVWERDAGRCAFQLENGEVCGSTYQLELDHLDGFALGGETTAERTRLCCKPHQDAHARALYGDDLMDRYTRGTRPRCSEPLAAYGRRGPPERERWCYRYAAATDRYSTRASRSRSRAGPGSPSGPGGPRPSAAGPGS